MRPQHKTEHGHKKPAQPTSGTTADGGYQRTLPTRGYLLCDCPWRSRWQKASGRTHVTSTSSRTAALETQQRAEDIPTSELETMQAERSLQEEQQSINGTASVVRTNHVEARSKSVGPTVSRWVECRLR